MNVGNRMGAVRGAVRTLWGHTTVCAPWGTSWTMTTTPVWMLTSAGPTSSTVLMNVSTWRAALDAPASMVTTCRMMGNPVKVRKEQPVTISSVAQKHHYITIPYDVTQNSIIWLEALIRWLIFVGILTDVDECTEYGVQLCEDRCINTEGSYQCLCTDLGYKLSWDDSSCSGA